MKRAKSNFMRAVNDVLMYDETERRFIDRLSQNVYVAITNLRCYMSKTMKMRILDIADAITTLVIYRLYKIDGFDNERHANKFIAQLKILRVFCSNLCECLSIHDLPDEILNKVETTGKPLFNFINKNYY